MTAEASTPPGSFPLDEVDPDALKVVRKLLEAGHEAYLVGGCVRDLYLHRRPKDFDVATSATPEVIRRLFRNSRVIGRRFKLAHVFFGPKIIETSTFRTAPRPSDGDDPLITHDNEWGSVEDDARRRDFTINGLFYDVENREVVDFVDGLSDLDAGVIRTIGEPELRFREDPVRMIRAVKFATRLDFTVEPETWSALLRVVPDIAKCSKSRLLEEVYKLLRGGAGAASVAMMFHAGLLQYVLPEYLALFGRDGLSAPEATDRDTPSAQLWRGLAALDRYVRATGDEPSNGLIQALLFAPLLHPSLEPELAAGRSDLGDRLEQIMTPPCVAMGVARRDRELAMQYLAAARPDAGRRGRRPRHLAVERPHLHDALVFAGIDVAARSDDGLELSRWVELGERARVRASGEATTAGRGRDGDGDDPRKSKRRRRGGRRKRSGDE